METLLSTPSGQKIVEPVILSDFAFDLQSESFKLDFCTPPKSHVKEAKRGTLVTVEFVRSHDEFSRLACACPAYNNQLHDECSSVVMHKRDAQMLGIFHGSFIDIKPVVQKSSDDVSEPVNKTRRVVALVTDCGQSLLTSVTDGVVTIKMLPVLWFNACRVVPDTVAGLNPLKHKQCILSRIQGLSEMGSSSSLSLSISYAKEIVVSCIYSPQYSTTASHDFLLKTYFSKPRLLQIGDVFGIHSAVDFHCFESIPDGSDVRHPVVYFWVKKLSASEKSSSGVCFVDQHHSQLLQESSVHGYIPSDMSSYYNLADWSQKLTCAFSEYICSLLKIFQPFIAKRKCEGLYPIVLLSGPTGSGLGMISKLLAAKLYMHHYKLTCSRLVTDTAASTEAKITQTLQIVGTYSPCILVLDGIEALGKDRDGHDDSRVASYFVSALKKLIDGSDDWPLVVIATTSSPAQVSSDIYQCFLHCVNVEVPDQQQRLQLLKCILSDDALSVDVSIDHVAQRSAGLVLEDFFLMLSYAKQFAYRRQQTQGSVETNSVLSEAENGPLRNVFELNSEDFELALNQLQSMHSEAIGAPKIPTVTWEDVGGLANVKSDILDTIQLPLQHPELLSLGLRRSGILLYGPPGTGKTLLAKAVATECSLNFLSVKGPELLNMYVGQSEENIRHVFERARTATPCVIFFDELDSLAPNRGRSGDSGGVMDRVVSQLLAELDGLQKSNTVFVIGATNRPDLIDPALLRPGRFDKLVYVGISEDKESQLKILKALTRKFVISPDCNLENVIEQCPLTLTGADFYALAADAMLNAIRRKIDELDAGSSHENDFDKLEVSEADFLEALHKLVPSLSGADLNRYRLLQQHYANPSKTLS